MHHAVLHHDVTVRRTATPWVRAQFGQNGFADTTIIDGTRQRDAGGQRTQQVGAGDNAEQFSPAQHRHALDVLRVQQIGDLRKRCGIGDSDDGGSHDLLRRAAMRVDIFGGEMGGRTRQHMPIGRPSFSAEFRATDQIALADDADQHVMLQDRDGADTVRQHQADNLGDWRVRGGDNCAGRHDVDGKHRGSLLLRVRPRGARRR